MSQAISDNKNATEENYEFVANHSAGIVNVANHEHGEGEAKEHTYTVSIDGTETTSCTCPSDTYHSGKCKHRQAVENDPNSLRPADCSCQSGSGQFGDLPCWPCYRDGFETRCGGTQ